MQKACVMRQRSKLSLKASVAPGVGRLKGSWRTRRSMRSHGDFRWKMSRSGRLWHGKQDRAFSVHLAEEVAKRLPDCNARFIDNAGHYSLPIRHMREILEDLVSV